MPPSSTRTDWKPAHVPKLSYRHSVHVDPAMVKSPTVEEKPMSAGSETTSKTSSSGSRWPESANTLRSTTSRESARSQNQRFPGPPASKKKSLFGGLFVGKEPTALALERLAAQLEAQHGELSARAVPGVSSSKLPQHVPKVNTKWDGVPDVVKERERISKEKARVAKRQSLAPSTRSRSAEGSRLSTTRPGERRPLQKRPSNSTLSSFDSRGRAGQPGHSQFSSTDDMRSPSTTPSTDLERGRPLNAPSTKSMSLRSPSGSSLPPITSFFPNDIPIQRSIPAKFKSENNHTETNSQSNISTGRTTLEQAKSTIEGVPEHSKSPFGTPLDRSPVTPSPFAANHLSEHSDLANWNQTDDAIFVSGVNVVGQSTPAKLRQSGESPRDAFLAGEARPFELPDDHSGPGPALIESESDLPLRRSPRRNLKALTPELQAHARVQQDLEKRPDSSRARLGLRASMLVRADQAPWDWQDFDRADAGTERSASPKLGLSKRLGKVNK